MARIVHLDQHVGRVQSSVLDLLDSPGCNLLVLSDLQIAVLAQMTFPYVWWGTRLVEDHGSYQVAVDFPQLYKDELECLELLLSGGSNMACDLSIVLAELADAIRHQPSGGGGCASSGPAAILNCVGQMTPEELIPQVEEEAPEYGVPPLGFATWDEYVIHKCKASYAIVDAVAGLFGALSLAPIAAITYEAVSALLTGYLGGIALGAVAFSPAAIVAIAAGAIAIGLLAGAAYIYLNDVKAYILAHKDELACSLFQSGSAAEAQAGIASVVEDAIQSVEWAVVFGPVVGPEIAALLGGIAGQTVSNNLVNPLFRVVEDFVYPDVSCCQNGGPSGPDWHFDADAEGWSFSFIANEGDSVTGAWDAGTGNPDPSDSSAGQLTCQIVEAEPPLGDVYGIWTYYFPFGQVPEVVAGDALTVDLYCSLESNAGYFLKIGYTDATYSQNEWTNPSGWAERAVAAIEGKFVNSLQIIFNLGETTTPHNYAADNVRWGQ